MSDPEEHKNGHGRKPEKKQEIGSDDVQNLIDFDDSDDDDLDFNIGDEDMEEESEEASESIDLPPMVNEDAAFVHDEDEMEDMSGGMPAIEYDFDPDATDNSSLEDELVIMEQQVIELADVLVDMVEEQIENQLIAEGQGPMEVACGKTEQEVSPQMLMEIKEREKHSPQGSEGQEGEQSGAGRSTSPVNEGQGEEPFYPEKSAVDQNVNREPSGSGQDPRDQDVNAEPSGSDRGSRDQGLIEEPPLGPGQSPRGGLNGEPSGSDMDPRDQGLNGNPSRSCQGSRDQGLNGDSSELGHGPRDQDLNEESSRQGLREQGLNYEPSGEPGQGPRDQGLNGEPSGSDQDPINRELNEEPSQFVHGSENRHTNIGYDLLSTTTSSGLDQDPFDLYHNGRLLRSIQGWVQNYVEAGPGSDRDALVQRLNEEAILEDPIEQKIQERGVAECEKVMEQLELDKVVNVQVHPIPVIGIERHQDLEQDIGLRDQIEETDELMKHERVADVNGGPDSGPDPGEQREKVGQAAANEAVAPPEAALDQPGDNVEAAADQVEEVVLDELDNLVEEQVEEVQAFPLPVPDEQDAIGGQDNVVAGDEAAEAQLI